MPAIRVVPILLVLSLALVVAACVPESDMERAPGGGGSDDQDLADLTPIPEEDLPELTDFELGVGTVDLRRGGNRVTAEIGLSASRDANVRIAGLGEMEWSDGEVTELVPMDGVEMRVESRRSDSSGVAEPVSIVLTNVSRTVGEDSEAEVTHDEIITQWGTFPITSIESASRPPGWRVHYQAAGQRWVSHVVLRYDSRVVDGDGSVGPFASNYRPQTGSLRFHAGIIDDLESSLPLPAEVEVREAIPRIELDV